MSSPGDRRCPSCGGAGRTVKAITIESLVTEEARARAGRTEGFRFCAEPACGVAYFHPEAGVRVAKGEVRVRIGAKETEPPRPLCYCFGHTVEELEAEVAATGASRIPAEIAAKCRQGLDRCEERNPKGSCCLGDVRRALEGARARLAGSGPGRGSPGKRDREPEGDCCAEEPAAARAPESEREPRNKGAER